PEGPTATPKKTRKPPVITDEDLEKLEKRERANALGSDKKNELLKSEAALSKKIKQLKADFKSEQANYLKLGKAKKKDKFLMQLSRESLTAIDKQRKALDIDVKAIFDKIREIDNKIKS
ncbi:MAG TPA: hypothetical protein VNY73_00980, partial [Bacteroidia bacterium]|nr:hypothetical protein [Bacteroidia bacterium]